VILVQDELAERGVLTAQDELWDVAVRQAAVIGRLDATGERSASAATTTAMATLS